MLDLVGNPEDRFSHNEAQICTLPLLLPPPATSSLAFTTATSSTAPVSQKSSLGPNSLVHCLMKYVAKDNQKEGILKSLFGLLSNLAMSSECRNIIWKVGKIDLVTSVTKGQLEAADCFTALDGMGWAALFYCGTPWAFHIMILNEFSV